MTSAQNREKLTLPLLSAKCPHWLNPLAPLSVRTHRKFQKIRCILPKKSVRPHLKNLLTRKMFALVNSPFPLIADVFYGQPLMNK